MLKRPFSYPQAEAQGGGVDMFKFGMKSDTIQFWLLVLSGIASLSGFAGWCDARYAHADRVKKLSWEVHALYLTIPESKRLELERDRVQLEIEQADQ
jgi:hypothetical protein